MSLDKTGVLLINLGTPQTPTVPSIRKFLKIFLMDRQVIQLPWLVRAILVYGFILPFRPKKLVPAYQSIWTQSGSPLSVISQKLKTKLQEQLGNGYQVELGMCYGDPGMVQALEALQKHCAKIIILPQFPQYAESTTVSAYQVIFEYFKKQIKLPELIMIRDFYAMPGFIQAQAELIKKNVLKQAFKPDYYLFSFHGLPESHVQKIDKVNCDLTQPCPSINSQNQYCYRAQCYETAKLLASNLNLPHSLYQVSFQSRLGRTPWIQPYTDQVLPLLIKKGIKNLVVACPAFTVDCLETLEEINIRAKEQWHALGGEGFLVIPCVNAEPEWVEALSNFIVKKVNYSPVIPSERRIQ